MIVEINASDIGYGGILKQKLESHDHGQRFGITKPVTKIEARSTTRKRIQKRRPKPNFKRAN